MSTNFAKFLSVRMIVKTEIAQVLILAHAKLGGPALTALIVFVYQAATMAFVIYPLNANATQDGLECFATSQCVNLDAYMVTVTLLESAYVILGGQEKTAQNVYHFLVVTGKTDIVTNQWNVNANLVITETSVSMPTVPPDVIHSMAIAYAQTHAGVTQVGQVQPVMNVCDTLDV